MALKIILQIVILLLVILSGFLLHTKGKPYPLLLFNVHKLSAVGLILFISIGIFQTVKASSQGTFIVLNLALLGLSVLILLLSGALAGNDKLAHSMQRAHKAGTILFVTCATILTFMGING
jgi:hypothetical protein